MTLIDHWVAGTAFAGESQRTAPVYNPALGVAQHDVRLASTADVDVAVRNGAEAQVAWGEASLAKRTTVMFAFREILVQRKLELAAILTSEHGKVTFDALGEIARGLEVVEYACGISDHLKGEFSQQVSTGVDVYTVKEAVGVVAIISPFNFPAMVPLWFAPVALAAGNSVVLKPSEKDPSAAIWLAEALKEAGLPDGVFNVVNGDKESVDALLTHPDVAAVSFVGSTPIARYIYTEASANGKRVQAFGGAKNHMLVLPDADLDLVADSAINAGFGSSGERCMAISVVVAIDSIADELVGKIHERIGGLKVGDGTRNCDFGPLITKEHQAKVLGYLDTAVADGATIVADGRETEIDGDPNGYWLGPTLIDHVPTSSEVYTHEIFGPVLSVVRVSTYEEGLALINGSQYGNGTAIFTNDGGAARRFQREVTVGMVGINVPIPVPVGYHSFGGWKDSHFGDTKAYGPDAVRFFTREKAITSRWLDPATHGGINLGFPQN